MDHAVNRASVSHEMSTEGRGSILPAERGNTIAPAETLGYPAGAGCFDEPGDYELGATGGMAGCDPGE